MTIHTVVRSELSLRRTAVDGRGHRGYLVHAAGVPIAQLHSARDVRGWLEYLRLRILDRLPVRSGTSAAVAGTFAETVYDRGSMTDFLAVQAAREVPWIDNHGTTMAKAVIGDGGRGHVHLPASAIRDRFVITCRFDGFDRAYTLSRLDAGDTVLLDQTGYVAEVVGVERSGNSHAIQVRPAGSDRTRTVPLNKVRRVVRCHGQWLPERNPRDTLVNALFDHHVKALRRTSNARPHAAVGSQLRLAWDEQSELYTATRHDRDSRVWVAATEFITPASDAQGLVRENLSALRDYARS